MLEDREQAWVDDARAELDAARLLAGHGICHLAVFHARQSLQISDAGELEAIVERVIEENPGPAEDFRGGKEKALGFLMGQVMKATGGQTNPQMVNELMREKLENGGQ